MPNPERPKPRMWTKGKASEKPPEEPKDVADFALIRKTLIEVTRKQKEEK